DFTRLPFAAGAFDLAIDRGALTCCGYEAGRRAVAEVRRVLRDGGRFLFNPYSDRHSSAASGAAGRDGLRTAITEGSLVDSGAICFSGRRDVEAALAGGWRILDLQHVEATEVGRPHRLVHAEWRVVAERCP